MSIPETYLFVYGTLQKGISRVTDSVAGDIEWMGSAGIKGRLFDLGEYPGAVEDNKGDLLIRGEIIRIKNPLEVFELLDRYEGYYPDDLHRSEFVRRKQVVYESNAKTGEAWVYLYNFPLEGKPEIKGKDYLEFLKQKGKRI